MALCSCEWQVKGFWGQHPPYGSHVWKLYQACKYLTACVDLNFSWDFLHIRLISSPLNHGNRVHTSAPPKNHLPSHPPPLRPSCFVNDHAGTANFTIKTIVQWVSAPRPNCAQMMCTEVVHANAISNFSSRKQKLFEYITINLIRRRTRGEGYLDLDAIIF